MIIIDEDAERKLARTLKNYLQNPGETGSAHFRFDAQAVDMAKAKALVCESTNAIITAEDKKIYFCESGDIYVFASSLPIKEAHKLALSIAKDLNLSTLDCHFDFIHLNEEASKILAALEKKFAQEESEQQQALAALEKIQQQERAVAKRLSILSIAADSSTGERIDSMRQNRKTPEIMMIEDDAFSRRLVERLLGQDYHVTGLGDTSVALDTYVQTAPDLLFLDINLPDVTGHELLERILLLDPKAFVVMLSGNADQQNIMEAMKRGAKGFVAKPFTPDKLHQYIGRCPTIH